MRPGLRSIITFLMSGFWVSQSYSQNFDFIADYVRFDEPAQIVTFEGQIEIETEFGYFYPSFVQYDLNTEILYTDGQLNGVVATGDRFIAQFAELDFKTQQVILRELKLKLLSELQITAKMAQNDDFSSYAENVIVSSCVICSLNPRPIWQIKAQQVLRDSQTERVYIKNGFLDLFGLPVFYIPFASIPEPGVKRMSGFLNPTLQATELGEVGIKLPYYFNFSETMDSRVVVYFNASETQYLEGDFRKNGKGYRLRSKGAYSISETEDLSNRYYLTNNLKVLLPYDFAFEANYSIQSDYDFQSLNDYARESSNSAYVERIKNYNFQHLGMAQYLPTSEAAANSTSIEYPQIYPHLQSGYSIAFEHGFIASGELEFIRVDNEHKNDTSRGSAYFVLSNSQFVDPGLFMNLNVGARHTVYEEFSELGSNPDTNSSITSPFASLDIRLPLVKTTQNTTQTLTPRLFLGWRDQYIQGAGLVLDVSFVERDYSDVFTLNMSEPHDDLTAGYRSGIGLTYLLQTQNNQTFEIGLARTWQDAFDESAFLTQLNPSESWLGYFNYSYASDWRIFSNFALGNDFSLARNEVNLQRISEWGSYTLKWSWLEELDELNYLDTQSQLDLVGKYRFHSNMEVGYDIGYDILTREPFDAQLALTYGNECIEINAAINWAFEDGVVLDEPKFELTVDLLGLDDRPNKKWKRRQCSY